MSRVFRRSPLSALRSPSRTTAIALCALAAIAASLVPARAAVSVYPSVLYGGMNVVSIDASSGVRRLQWRDRGRWIDVRRGQAMDNLRIVSVRTPSSCIRQMKLYLFVPEVTSSAEIDLRVLECDGSERRLSLSTGATWQVDHQRMGDAKVGETVCQQFSVRSTTVGEAIVVDRVVSPTGKFELRFTGRRPPVRIPAGRAYYYEVCFHATSPGRHKMPIHVYIRRAQPSGGFTSFIVADTAYVTVVAPPPTPRVQQPVKPRVIAPKRPPTNVRPPTIPRPVIPVAPPPRVPDVDVVSPRATARAIVPVDTERLRAQPDVGAPTGVEAEISDPTTFRTVLLPTARSIPEGEGFIGSYDVAGVLAGYGVTDRLTVLAGGLFIPAAVATRAIDVTAGARYELHRGDYTRLAAGVQFNHSDTDSSSITVGAPYLVASLGDDDRRASVALSYSTRRHDPVSGEPFMRNAIVVAAGGDLRIGGNWKVAAEAYWIEGSTYQPLVATVRHFGRRYAIDAGVAVNMAGDEARVAPVVSVLWVFGR